MLDVDGLNNFKCNHLMPLHFKVLKQGKLSQLIRLIQLQHAKLLHIYTVSQKKVPTFKLSVTLSNLNRFEKFLHC